MNDDENKEELEKKESEENNVQEENNAQEVNTQEQEKEKEPEQVEQKSEEEETPQEKEEKKEVDVDSETYYDDIDYQKKEEVEEVKEKTRSVLREVLDWVICIALAFVAYLLINYFLFCAPTVKQASMYPTIQNGEKVITIRTWLRGNKYEYGDIITFEAPIDNKLYLDSDETLYTAQYENYTGLTLFLYKFLDVNKVSYIKRVIGLPGDHIEIKDGCVYRNGEKLEEDYIRSDVSTDVQEEEYADVIVPEDTVYVLGDNREQSKDSRTFGCIPYDRINGYLVCRIWPLNKIGGVD